MNRWINLFGRIGTVIIAIDLSILLAYLIPPSYNSFRGGTITLGPERFYYTTEHFYLNSQYGARIELNATGTLDAYTLKVDYTFFYNWLYTHVPNPQRPESRREMDKLSMLQAFLSENPNIIIQQGQIPTGTSAIEYFPTTEENVTFVFSNPSTEERVVACVYKAMLINVIANKGLLLTAIEETIPFGIILTVPWLTLELRRKRVA